ncbi:transcriptional regulator [Zobellella sp. DQSA1]|uniref:winged helix-turn-helix domain-containing protein n=1 Tax=Zobellella sp. DQSA1 TaxID=3342386 RepID=UPI0035BFEEA8
MKNGGGCKKMLYVINGRLVFNDEDGSIRLSGEDEVFALLPSPASRLLSYFIEHNGRNISRDELLSEVWDKYGLVASGNNLNNYVSMLRRSLSEAGENELIVTIPRFGFSFNAGVQVEGGGKAVHNSNEFSDSIFGHGVFIIRDKPYLLKAGLILAMVVLMMLTYLGTKKLWSTEVVEYQVNLGSIDNCKVYTVIGVKSAHVHSDDMLNNVSERLKELKLSCSQPAEVYYFENADWLWSKKGGVKGAYFVAYCPSGFKERAHYSHCENISLYEYQ